MRNNTTLGSPFVAVSFALCVLAAPGAAFSSPPANDDLVNADAIPSLPFADSGDLNGTTTEPGEPQFCNFLSQTVWYAFTPTTTTAVKADLNGSEFGLILNTYQSFGGGIGGLGFMGCTGVGGSFQFTANAGTTYYLQVGSNSVGPAHAQLNVAAVPPPPNDAFASAVLVGAVPFTDNVDLTAATTEAGEQVNPGVPFTIGGSVWYSYTPTATESLTASASGTIPPVLAVYTGTSLADLSLVAGRFAQPVTFGAAAGTTYHFQLARPAGFGTFAQMTFQLAVTPPPVANFFFNPFDPSSFDLVQFFDQSFDPGQAGFESQAWTFGDGATATGCCPAHRYAVDGDYTARLTVRTVDGRTATVTRTIAVRTHDVAITRFVVPSSGTAGRTRPLSVGVSNVRYPDTVQVQLFKSVPGSFNSFQLVGTLTQLTPVLNKNRTVPFDFTYTFTDDDAVVGKVTFQAIASIIGGRDAQSADNTAISAPVRVSP